MKHLFYLPLLLCLLLSNCTWLCTNQHFYNHAREGECVLLPGGTKGKMPLYKADGKVYVQGIRTTYIEKRGQHQNVWKRCYLSHRPCEHSTNTLNL